MFYCTHCTLLENTVFVHQEKKADVTISLLTVFLAKYEF